MMLIAGAALLSACSPSETGLLGAPLVGQDGDKTVAGREVVNRYARLGMNANPGDRQLSLLSAAPLMPLMPGDLLLIIQMQGAGIDTSDTANFGNITALGNAGRYELVTIDAVSGNTVTLDRRCALRNGYTAEGGVQVVRVPQYRSLAVPSGATLTAPPWNGQVGGLVAVHVQGGAQIDGAVDVAGLGFRGGELENESGPLATPNVTFRSAGPTGGGEKGESIAGGREVYQRLGIRYGRGAPANGGGGGNAHNAAGGGGANGDSGRMWTGQGVMDGAAMGSQAWRLDPAFLRNGNQLTDSSGGGRGGYSYATSAAPNNPNPLVSGPGGPGWGGNGRRETGGWGGRPLRAQPQERLFFGGGGGAGDGNNNAAGGGGAGGGLVLLIADSVRGGGVVRADGAGGGATRNGNDDAAGGGGGGGAVLISARQAEGVAVSARGGKGGDQLNGPGSVLTRDRECEGPGGGGGGGAIAVPQGLLAAASAAGGAGGTSASPFITNFPANGATGGAAGVTTAAPPPMALPACLVTPDTTPDGGPGGDGGTPPGGGADLAIRITPAPDPFLPGDAVTWTIAVTNHGPDTAQDVRVVFTVPEDQTIETVTAPGWSCTTQGRTVTCTRPSLDKGAAPDIVIRTRPSEGSANPASATATVGAATPDPDLKNNSATGAARRAGVSLAGGGLTCSAGRSAAGAPALLLFVILIGAGLFRRRLAGR